MLISDRRRMSFWSMISFIIRSNVSNSSSVSIVPSSKWNVLAFGNIRNKSKSTSPKVWEYSPKWKHFTLGKTWKSPLTCLSTLVIFRFSIDSGSENVTFRMSESQNKFFSSDEFRCNFMSSQIWRWSVFSEAGRSSVRFRSIQKISRWHSFGNLASNSFQLHRMGLIFESIFKRRTWDKSNGHSSILENARLLRTFILFFVRYQKVLRE